MYILKLKIIVVYILNVQHIKLYTQMHLIRHKMLILIWNIVCFIINLNK